VTFVSALPSSVVPVSLPAIAALRSAAAPFHRRLDARMGIVLPGAGRRAYALHVAAMWGWMQPIEPMVWSGGWPAETDVPARAVTSRWLEEDLAAARRDGYLEGDLPRREAKPAFRSLAERMGWAYVIESTMQVAHMLNGRVGVGLAPWPVRYFSGYGDENAQRWRDFQAVVGSRLRTAGEVEDAARSARLAFESLEDWFGAQGAG
jgi:heme oxygenase